MKLFIWTYTEPETCEHRMAFAETEEEARGYIEQQIRDMYKNPDEFESAEHLAMRCEHDIAEFNCTEYAYWTLEVREIAAGAF